MGLDSRAEQWIQERIRIHGCSSLVINGLRTEFHARDALGVTREHDTAMIAERFPCLADSGGVKAHRVEADSVDPLTVDRFAVVGLRKHRGPSPR